MGLAAGLLAAVVLAAGLLAAVVLAAVVLAAGLLAQAAALVSAAGLLAAVVLAAGLLAAVVLAAVVLAALAPVVQARAAWVVAWLPGRPYAGGLGGRSLSPLTSCSVAVP